MRALASTLIGIVVTLLSTFVGQRWANATYPDIMGCEEGCRVVATGWPLVFVRDYTGMSVVNTADILEVILAADRLDWPPFCANVIFWTVLALLLSSGLRNRKRTIGSLGVP